MKKMMTLGAMLLSTTPSFAADLEINEMFCSRSMSNQYQTMDIRLTLSDLVFKSGMTPADAGAASMNFALNMVVADQADESDGPMMAYDMATETKKGLKSDAYTSRKYPGHYRFSLSQKGTPDYMKGKLNYDRAQLILNPAYTVVKTTRQTNNWDKKWFWDKEVRKHSAVLDLSLNDHHGDYVKLDCYSSDHVNDSRRPAKPTEPVAVFEGRSGICSDVKKEGNDFTVMTSNTCVDYEEVSKGVFQAIQGVCGMAITKHQVVATNAAIAARLNELVASKETACVLGMYKNRVLTVDEIVAPSKMDD